MGGGGAGAGRAVGWGAVLVRGGEGRGCLPLAVVGAAAGAGSVRPWARRAGAGAGCVPSWAPCRGGLRVVVGAVPGWLAFAGSCVGASGLTQARSTESGRPSPMAAGRHHWARGRQGRVRLSYVAVKHLLVRPGRAATGQRVEERGGRWWFGRRHLLGTGGFPPPTPIPPPPLPPPRPLPLSPMRPQPPSFAYDGLSRRASITKRPGRRTPT